MSGNSEGHGLCSTCQNVSDCTLRVDTSLSVLQCEEFAPYESHPRKVSVDASSADSPGKSGPAEEEQGRYMGLCRDCDTRETCQYPKPEGGVWHCEEFLDG